MRIILSRKGFDSQYGKNPSPIFADGRAVSLPIPTSSRSPTRYSDVRYHLGSLGDLVGELTDGRITGDRWCHLDPDLDVASLDRPAGWKAAFGQVGSAQAHLDNQGVGPGDIFLYFGLFRRVHQDDAGGWRFLRRARRIHKLYGWLQVGEVLCVGENPAGALANRSWLAAHPHLNGAWKANNTVYVAADKLLVGDTELGLPGAGCFTAENPLHTLTASAQDNKPSVWRLPSWFTPTDGGEPGLTFHTKSERWIRDGQWAILRSVAKGQEFVFETDHSREQIDWLAGLFMNEGRDASNLSVRGGR